MYNEGILYILDIRDIISIICDSHLDLIIEINNRIKKNNFGNKVALKYALLDIILYFANTQSVKDVEEMLSIDSLKESYLLYHKIVNKSEGILK